MTRSRHRFTTTSVRLFLALVFLVACTLPCSIASAQTSTKNLDQARQLFQEGNEAYRARNWTEAYDRFKEAFALSATYDIAGNLGDVELTLEKSATPPNISRSASATGPPDKRKPAPKPKPASTKPRSSSRG